MDDMVPRSQGRNRHRNEGGSISDSGQARNSTLPTIHEHFLSFSAGSMVYSSPSDGTMAGLMQSQVAHNVENVMLPTNTQSHNFGGNVSPGYAAEDTSRTLPSHSHGITISGNDIVGDGPWLSLPPSPPPGQSYLGVAGNAPIGFMSSTNAGQKAFQQAGSAGDHDCGEYNVMSSLYRPWSYQNQSTDGGFLNARLGNYTLSGTRFNDHSGVVGDPSCQAIAPQLDASLPKTGYWIGGYQSLNNNNPGIDNIYSHGVMLDDAGQAGEQTAPYEFDVIAEGAVRGAYEFDCWLAQGRDPPPPWPPAHASSSVPPIPYNSPEPQERGQSTEQGVPTAYYPWPRPQASPNFQSQISIVQSEDVMVSAHNKGAGAPSFQGQYDQTISDHAVLQDFTESGLGTWLPGCLGQASGSPTGQLSLPGIGSAAEADAGGGSSSALPEPIGVTPIRPSPRAIPPHLASGNREKALTIDGNDGHFLLFGRPLLPQRPAVFAGSGRPLKRGHDQTDLIPFYLQQPLRDTWIRVDSSDDMPELLGHKCELCNTDLALKPTGSRIDAVPVHVILPCGHTYHSSCFDEVHGFVGRNEDPPCSRCSDGGAQGRN